MFWQYLLTAIALVLVLEGILPFSSPQLWRKILIQFAQRSDRIVRFAGLVSMLAGVILMYLIHSGSFY